MNKNHRTQVFNAPWLLATGFMLLGLAILEKALNLAGAGIPMINVFPRQLLDWAVAIMIFEIAITLRHIHDRSRGL